MEGIAWGQKKKRYFSHYCVRIPDNVRESFTQQTLWCKDSLCLSTPTGDPALILLICGSHTSNNAWHCLFMIWNHSLVWTGRVWYRCCVEWGWGADDTTQTTGCDFIKGKCVRKGLVSAQAIWGKTAWTCIKLPNMQSPQLVLSHGWLCLRSQLGLKLWILDSSQVALIYLAFILLLVSPPSDTVLANFCYGPSPLLFVGIKLFGFYLFFWSHMSFPRLTALFLVWFTGFSHPWNANITGLKPDKCQHHNFTDRRCWVPTKTLRRVKCLWL